MHILAWQFLHKTIINIFHKKRLLSIVESVHMHIENIWEVNYEAFFNLPIHLSACFTSKPEPQLEFTTKVTTDPKAKH